VGKGSLPSGVGEDTGPFLLGGKDTFEPEKRPPSFRSSINGTGGTSGGGNLTEAEENKKKHQQDLSLTTTALKRGGGGGGGVCFGDGYSLKRKSLIFSKRMRGS